MLSRLSSRYFGRSDPNLTASEGMLADNLDEEEQKRTLLPPDLHTQTPQYSANPPKEHNRNLGIFTILALLIGALGGCLATRFAYHDRHHCDAEAEAFPNNKIDQDLWAMLRPTGERHEVWHHNQTFSQRPTDESERAWDSIIPMGWGFIYHEEYSPLASNIAVFHQLHCLHALLAAYYNARKSKTEPGSHNSEKAGETDDKTGSRIDPHHVEHCFDYLRRSLMCCVDTNLEILDLKTHSTNGWGQEKLCRDYNAVVKIAEKWRNSSDVGIISIT